MDKIHGGQVTTNLHRDVVLEEKMVHAVVEEKTIWVVLPVTLRASVKLGPQPPVWLRRAASIVDEQLRRLAQRNGTRLVRHTGGVSLQAVALGPRWRPRRCTGNRGQDDKEEEKEKQPGGRPWKWTSHGRDRVSTRV